MFQVPRVSSANTKQIDYWRVKPGVASEALSQSSSLRRSRVWLQPNANQQQAYKCEGGAIKTISFIDTPHNSSFNSVPTSEDKSESIKEQVVVKETKPMVLKNNYVHRKRSRDGLLKQKHVSTKVLIIEL